MNLANKACDIEINQLKLPTGKQDQFAASFGGLNLMRFKKNGKTLIEKIGDKNIIKFLNENIIIINTGVVKKNKAVSETAILFVTFEFYKFFIGIPYFILKGSEKG